MVQVILMIIGIIVVYGVGFYTGSDVGYQEAMETMQFQDDCATAFDDDLELLDEYRAKLLMAIDDAEDGSRSYRQLPGLQEALAMLEEL